MIINKLLTLYIILFIKINTKNYFIGQHSFWKRELSAFGDAISALHSGQGILPVLGIQAIDLD